MRRGLTGITLVSPLPSLFDFSVIFGVCGMLWLPKQFHGVYLVWFSIYLCSLTLFTRPKREWSSIGLGLTVLWGFLAVFIHSWCVDTNGVIYKWVNFSLMSEGFIYMLFGALLIKNIVNYSTNIRLLMITLPISAIPWIQHMIYHGQITPILAVAVSGIIFLIIKKEYLIAGIIITITTALVGWKWEWVCMKWACRPYVWMELLKQMMEYPFVGAGYNHALGPDNMTWIRQIGAVTYGWLWRHNDYFSVAAFLGTPVLLTIGVFVIEVLRKIRFKMLFLVMLLTCFFQMTMFVPDRAMIFSVMTAYLIWTS